MNWRKKGSYVTALCVVVLTRFVRLPEEEIRARVASLRQGLRARLERAPTSYSQPTHAEVKGLRPSDTHARSAAKERESSKMQRALHIRPDYEEGQAFDPVLQERRKQERIEERERRREDAALPDARGSSRWDRVDRDTPARGARRSCSRSRSPSPARRSHVSYEDAHMPPSGTHLRTPSPPPTHTTDP